MLQDAAQNRPTRSGYFLLAVLWAARIPSIVVPAGGDQGLYSYVGQRFMAGDVLYRDVWDQKPPGIEVIYGWLWRLWPHGSVVAAADIAVAGLVAALLVVLGRRLFSSAVGIGAAAVFLVFGSPSFQRLDGVFVRSQCETFIALFVALALLCTVKRAPGRAQLLAAGACLAAAFWLKYNAIAYALPMAAALYEPGRWRQTMRDCAWAMAGLGLVVAGGFAYFAAHGAIEDLRLATIDYNVRYASEAFGGTSQALFYPLQLLLDRVHLEAMWFIGGIGAVLLAWRMTDRNARIALLWLIAAIVSISINARNLPQYFVQAHPALALAGAAGIASLSGRTLVLKIGVATLLAIGVIWQVGDEPRGFLGMRWAGLPGVVANLREETAYFRGRVDRATYLDRFGGQRMQDKFSASAYDAIAARVDAITAPSDRVLVFGFASGGILTRSNRLSASRFILNRPVVMEFAADHPGYGSAALFQELQRTSPGAVVLQKQDWGPVGASEPDHQAEPNSADFFHHNAVLESWLTTRYTRDLDTPEFEVWKRAS